MFNQFDPERTTLNYIVEPFVHKDEEGYKPGIRYGFEGQPLTTQVFIMTFDEERFAMPYARDFARANRQMAMRGFDIEMDQIRKRLGL